MKQIIKDVLEDMSNGQVNLASSAARELVATTISAALKTKGSYIVFTDSEIDAQKARETWVCSICGKNTADVDYDYLGSGTNHLGCELAEGFQEITKDRREKNRLQKKHEDKVFGHDQGGSYEYPYNSFVRSKEDIQKQAYLEMTSDGLPEGGDAQAVLESHKLAEEIVEAQEGTWIYESPDGGKTVFRRPFSDYDPKNKEEIDFKTKEPTGRKFTDYPFVEDVQIDGC